MAVFNKKDTLIKTISFMAIMAAINIILSLVCSFVPAIYVIVILVLPLTSALITIYCKSRYFPIYAVATLGLSLAVSFWNFDFTLFYLLPSIITGFIFGLMVKNNITPLTTILLASLSQTSISFALIPLIKLITQRDLISDLQNIFNLTGWTELNNYILLMFFCISLVQVLLSFLIMKNEIKKLHLCTKKFTDFSNKYAYIIFVLILLSIGMYFIEIQLSNLCIGISLLISLFFIIKNCFEKSFRKLIISGVAIFLNIFVFAVFSNSLGNANVLLLQFSPLFIGIISLISI